METTPNTYFFVNYNYPPLSGLPKMFSLLADFARQFHHTAVRQKDIGSIRESLMQHQSVLSSENPRLKTFNVFTAYQDDGVRIFVEGVSSAYDENHSALLVLYRVEGYLFDDTK